MRIIGCICVAAVLWYLAGAFVVWAIDWPVHVSADDRGGSIHALLALVVVAGLIGMLWGAEP